ncbi:two-component system response regulator NarL [Chitinasiproducens palmae]|uniref:Two component transcriptional regulator, LuxR family n=1 Tax=Chitinasiproducens palmae TaxID=1770053 RepID=A0A1H2PTR5_9BURK|nr:two-component system response regulator NarL [Chitinasiproducens palmae]SDV50518.1 two component transcriptional regulator, LuxR family [Chitinasiproducens palmae]
MTDDRHTILLVDDHPMMRRGIRQLLELEDDLRVCGEAGDGEAALALADELAPQLILLDNNMARLNGVETLRRLRQNGYAGKVLLFTVSDAEDDVHDALRLGADGYLLKDMEPEHLVREIRNALRGELVVSPSLAKVLAQGLRAPRPATQQELTERERQVLRMVMAGNSNKVIGARLGITEGTVKVHMKNLLQKLKLRSRVEAAVWALEHLT